MNSCKLLKKLSFLYPDSSINTLKQWIRDKRIQVNNRIVVDPCLVVKEDDNIFLTKKRDYIDGIEVIYSDPKIIVLKKPMGLLSVDSNDKSERSLQNILKLKMGAVYPVHRLDREVEGLILYAKNKNMAFLLKKKFEEKLVKRTYFAIVEGTLKQNRGIWKSYLTEVGNFNMAEVDDPSQGKYAETHWEVIRSNTKFSLLRINLETGRKHQIRLHCKTAGNPIIGDLRYNSSGKDYSSMGLFAKELVLMHEDKKRSFSIPFSHRFCQLLQQCQLQDL